MLYVLLTVNMLWLVMVSAFIAYFVAKGQIVISPRQVLDKETSIELAKKMEQQVKESWGDY